MWIVKIQAVTHPANRRKGAYLLHSYTWVIPREYCTENSFKMCKNTKRLYECDTIHDIKFIVLSLLVQVNEKEGGKVYKLSISGHHPPSFYFRLNPNFESFKFRFFHIFHHSFITYIIFLFHMLFSIKCCLFVHYHQNGSPFIKTRNQEIFSPSYNTTGTVAIPPSLLYLCYFSISNVSPK